MEDKLKNNDLLQGIIGSMHDLSWSQKVQRKFFRHETGSNLEEKLSSYIQIGENMVNFTKKFESDSRKFSNILNNEKKSTRTALHHMRIPENYQAKLNSNVNNLWNIEKSNLREISVEIGNLTSKLDFQKMKSELEHLKSQKSSLVSKITFDGSSEELLQALNETETLTNELSGSFTKSLIPK